MSENNNHSKRALSLDDLVNHDENDKIKLKKLSGIAENNLSHNDTEKQPTLSNITNPKDETAIEVQAPATSTANQEGNTPIKGKKNDSDSDDDDYDVTFDMKMSFDYDDQVQESPVKVEQASNSKNGEKSEIASNKPGDKKQIINDDSVKVTEKSDAAIADDKKTELKENKEEQTSNNEIKPETKQDSKTTSVTNADKDKVDHIFEEKTSTKSKRNIIKKDLEILSEISSVSKPNKYTNVPIWAQKWKPTIKALENINLNEVKNIDTSFLNIIPDDDLTKSIQDWVYATIFSIDPEMKSYIELEVKFGLIKDAKSSDRVNPPISSQAIFTDLDCHMKPTIDEVLFNEITKYIKNVSELNEHVGKFSVIESNTTDSLYRVGISTQRPRFLRMSRDVNTGRIGQFIEKRTVSSLLIYAPKDSYDMKISINLEIPVPENEPPEKFMNQQPLNERVKDRISFIHNDSCTRFDMTKVKNLKSAQNNDVEETFEIELEINTSALLKAFDNISVDSKEYAALIRTFLNNASIIRRKLTTLSSEIFEGQKRI